MQESLTIREVVRWVDGPWRAVDAPFLLQPQSICPPFTTEFGAEMDHKEQSAYRQGLVITSVLHSFPAKVLHIPHGVLRTVIRSRLRYMLFFIAKDKD